MKLGLSLERLWRIGAAAIAAAGLAAGAGRAADFRDSVKFAPEDRPAAEAACPLVRHFDEWWIADAERFEKPDDAELAQCARNGRAGDARAQLAMANYFVANAHLRTAIQEAYRWSRAASDAGFAPASLMAALLELYAPTADVRNERAGRETLRRAVAANYAPALQLQAEILLGTAGSQADRDAARGLLARSAALGWAESAKLLGNLHAAASNGSAERAEAAKWYRRAAELGDVGAQKIVAELERAELAAASANAEALFRSAQAHRLGEGAPRNARAAARLFRSAADAGHLEAIEQLGAAYQFGLGIAKDRREAVRLYRMAAERGLASAQLRLAAMYRNGTGVPRDDRAAFGWNSAAAAQGSAAGQYERARMFELGRGGRRYIAAAESHYALAALQSYEKAVAALARLRIPPDAWLAVASRLSDFDLCDIREGESGDLPLRRAACDRLVASGYLAEDELAQAQAARAAFRRAGADDSVVGEQLE